MKELEKVLVKTTWNSASYTINRNSDYTCAAINALENAAFRHKGYFVSIESLEAAYPSPEKGSQAFVYNVENPEETPYDVYHWTTKGWAKSGITGGNIEVNIEAVQKVADNMPIVFSQEEQKALEEQGKWQDILDTNNVVYVYEE
jgi:hypothetical protein